VPVCCPCRPNSPFPLSICRSPPPTYPPTSIPDGPHLDHEALIKKVVDLKKQQLALRIEQAGLEAETTSFEKNTASLKQQYNIIGAAAEVSGWGLEPPVSTPATGRGAAEQEKITSAHGNAGASAGAVVLGKEDMQFRQQDETLELTVLNEEIRGCLPGLEAQALYLESQIYAIDKATAAALAAQKELPPLLNKTAEELEGEMGMTIEKKILVKTQMAAQVTNLRKEKSTLVARISSLREQLALAADERDVLNNTTAELRMGMYIWVWCYPICFFSLDVLALENLHVYSSLHSSQLIAHDPSHTYYPPFYPYDRHLLRIFAHKSSNQSS